MLRPLHIALIVLLLAQLVLVVVARAPWRDAGEAPGKRLFPGLEVARVAAVEIEGAADETLRLERGAEGWVLPSLEGFPAEDEEVEALVTTLAELEARSVVARSPRYHESLEVTEDSWQRRVALLDENDEVLAELVVGSSPQYRLHHVRRGGEDAVFEVADLAPYDMRPDAGAWAMTMLVEVPVDAVERVELSNAQGSFALERSGDEGAWRIVEPSEAGERALDGEKVRELVRRLARVRVDAPLGPRDDAAQGFDDPAARWTFRVREDAGPGASAASRSVIVLVGDTVAEDDDARFASRGDLAWTVRVADSAVDDALEASLEGLEAGPEEAAEVLGEEGAGG